MLNDLKESIKIHLRRGDKYVYDIIMSYKNECFCADTIWEESVVYNEFSQEIELCENKLKEKIKDIDEDDMPF